MLWIDFKNHRLIVFPKKLKKKDMKLLFQDLSNKMMLVNPNDRFIEFSIRNCEKFTFDIDEVKVLVHRNNKYWRTIPQFIDYVYVKN